MPHQHLAMQEHHFLIPYFNHQRRVRVLLPSNYQHEPHQRYPVLYMHDGQNVFYSKESYSGHSWKVIPTLKRQQDLPKLMIVGIDHASEKRLDEYGPWKTDRAQGHQMGHSGGLGIAYGNWLVHTLKPFIDQHYRTLPERQHTLTAGSSMGGIITAYLGAAYPEVFGHLGVFSLASWFSESAFLDYLNHHPLKPDSRVFIQVGTNEGDEVDALFIQNMSQTYIDCTLRYYQSLLKHQHPLQNIRLHITAHAIHHEKHWADHFADFIRFSLAHQG
ncbi:MAG: alpha/beta hydrolase-fold protein [Cardiobacteriaceae bacterium]|nr:alpha/beta hydrolase-fold protein [Cardiobacteriaceae bacterium]